MRSSGIDIILRSLREIAGPVHTHGATSAAGALITARYALARRDTPGTGPLVVLCPTEDSANDVVSDVENIARAALGAELTVCAFPTWEQSAYSSIAPSIRTRLTRIAVLDGLASPGTDASDLPDVIVTTLAASSQATLPREVLVAHTVEVKLDDSVESREALMARLLQSGYLRVDPVEDPGTFAVRGDIIDVYPPDRDRPLRIELFGDIVDKIREFDPASQRALDTALGGAVRLPPAREVLINPETVARVREKVKERADDTGIPRPRRDPILASVQSGNYPDHADAWAPFAYERPATLWDYLPPGARVVWVDELTTQQEWDKFLEEQKREAEGAAESAVIAPPVDELFRWTPALEKSIREGETLFLDRIALATAESIGAEADADETGADPETAAEPKVGSSQRVWVRGNGSFSQSAKHPIEEIEPRLRGWLKRGYRVIGLASTQSQLERMRFLLDERGFAPAIGAEALPSTITLREGTVSEGFRWPVEGLVILTESELLGAKHVRRSGARNRRGRSEKSGSAAKDWSGLQALSDLAVGDAVVHVDHGIGRYQGLVRLDLAGAPMDFLQLEYANKDKLYLPVYRLNVIQKYVGSGESANLDRLGSQQFAKTKEKVRDAVKKLAVDLIKLYAERKVRPGIPLSGRDGLLREFEAKFPYDETPDQLKAIDDVLGDLESGRSMDRLVCGDVGYGKTEVAIRAAFRAVSDGKQVVVLVPTTVLAFQHEQNFRNRMKDYPINIDSLSRFKSAREQKATLEALASGKLDIVIGTHRLLSKDVEFNDLGLIIVDEEHRFGVEHKEKLKTLKVNTHVLTLTATPIPRTLHMALSGLRDISLINTPPVDRLPIRTYVSKRDENLIQRAIEFELNRGGQVFFLHNRVQTIHETAKLVRDLVPAANVGVGHGQMTEGELEQAMLAFYEKRTNVLVCTAIIESGLDVPSANTIIVDRADALGLAQLYQIRGRVGRGQQRAYAYLLLPPEAGVTDDAKRRLEVIQRFVELGSGFSIASHDLEIRGGGDLLGPQQSGHIAAVGFDLYTELLEEAIGELQRQPGTASGVSASREPEIKAPFPAFLAEQYVPDIHQRLSLYRRFSAAANEEELVRLEEELRDRYGALPAEAQNLLWMIRIKQLLKRSGIDTLTVGPEKVSMLAGPGSRLDPARVIARISARPGEFQLTPDSKLVAKVPTGNLRDLFFGIEKLLTDLSPRQA